MILPALFASLGLCIVMPLKAVALEPENATVDQGDTRVFRCLALQGSGSLRLQEVSWKRNGRPLDTSGFSPSRIFLLEDSSLVLSGARIEDSGTYTCVTVWKNNRWVTVLKHSSVNLRVMRKLDVKLEERCGKVGLSRHARRAPWMAMLYSKSKGQPFCGGTLISNQWILSACHCLRELDTDFDNFETDVVVKLGADDWHGREYEIATGGTICHGNYGSGSEYDQDLLLIKLNEKVTYDNDVWPICLPLTNMSTTAGKVGLMTGWGARSLNGRPSRNMKTLGMLPVRNRSQCHSTIPSGHTFTTNMFCAGQGNGAPDQCKGDSGGPFAVQRLGKWYLGGVVSFGQSCEGRRNRFGYYVEVSEYYQWIRQKVFEHTGATIDYETYEDYPENYVYSYEDYISCFGVHRHFFRNISVSI